MVDFDLAASYHDYLDAVERAGRPYVCPACDNSGRTRADHGWVRCHWCRPPDRLEDARARVLAARLYGAEVLHDE